MRYPDISMNQAKGLDDCLWESLKGNFLAFPNWQEETLDLLVDSFICGKEDK